MDLSKSCQRIQKDIEALARFTSTPGEGCTRLPFTPQARQAADYLRAAMQDAGLNAHEDAAGNVFGVLPGQSSDRPCVMSGSHFDTVFNGGAFDGPAGVICALELARILRDEGRTLPMDYVVSAFMDEEGCRFGTGYFGSRSMLGQMTAEECKNFADRDDITVYDAMKSYRLTPEKLPEAAWKSGSIGHFIELHIEQGPVLVSQNVDIGLVDCIVGIKRFMVSVFGQANHAGTTPMNMRHDPMEMASRVISKIGDTARAAGGGTVATVGFVKAEPGGMNVIASRVDFTLDIRAVDPQVLASVAGQIEQMLREETVRCGGSYHMEPKLDVAPLQMSGELLARFEASCRAHGYSCLHMPSGAGHDALAIGRVYDTAMLFVPSRDGKSHCPEEWTDYSYFAKAVQVLYDVITALA